MIGVLSWSGRGLIVLPLLFVPMVFMAIFDTGTSDASVVAFGIGWLLSGVTCLVLGKLWNADGPRHKFGRLRLEKWGYIFLGLGLLITVPKAVSLIKGPPEVHLNKRTPV